MDGMRSELRDGQPGLGYDELPQMHVRGTPEGERLLHPEHSVDPSFPLVCEVLQNLHALRHAHTRVRSLHLLLRLLSFLLFLWMKRNKE